MKLKTLTLLFLLFLGTNAFSQTNLDSLYAVWEDETQSDSVRVEAYQTYIWEGFLFSQPESAFALVGELYSFGNNNNYRIAIAVFYNLKGVLMLNQGDYFKSLKYFKQGLAINTELGYQKGIGSCLGNIGLIYKIQGDFVKALDFFEKSLAIGKKNGNQSAVASGLGNIALIYKAQGEYDKALEYFEKSLAIDKKNGDQIGVAHNLTGIGNLYVEKANYIEALEYYEKSLAILEEQEDRGAIANNLLSIGIVYSRQSEVARALAYYEQSLLISEELGNQFGIANSLKTIGFSYGRKGDFVKALDYCQKSYEIYLSIGVLSGQKECCQCQYNVYKAMGNGNKALEFLEKIQVIDDSLNAEETIKKLQQMEFAKAVYADSVEKAEEARLIKEAHEAEVAQKNKTRNIAIGGGILALLLAGGFYSRNRYIKKSRDVISKEKDRSENLLLNILPAEIAEELKANGEAAARDFEQVSILFTDFKQFTQLSEKLSAKELVAELNYCFKAFDGICEKYGIEKIKTLGDSYMAAGGLPVPTEDATHRLILAALDMSEFVLNRQKEREAQGQIPFEMRTGIHTGNVVAGIVGVKKFQYDIWGDTVNTASRMESHGEVGKVNISQATYELIKDDPQFAFEHRGKVSAKGKGEVDMWFVQKVN